MLGLCVALRDLANQIILSQPLKAPKRKPKEEDDPDDDAFKAKVSFIVVSASSLSLS
jgi:hypothetical protein